MQHGFIYRAPEKEDYHADGRTRLGGLPIQPDGQWDKWLPTDELQDRGFSTMACATFGTLNAVEILERQEFGDTTDWSDRFLAETSGTTYYGNDPHTVAETLRKKGDVAEADWPYSPDITTWGAFYQAPPPNLVTLALQFPLKYDFAHQYVGTDQQSMMNALMYSPLGADVFAWNPPDENGIYHREGKASEHWIVIYGYLRNNYWLCLDTYDNTKKKLAWDFGFTMVKQYTLHKNVVHDDLWKTFLKWFRSYLGLDKIQRVLGLGDYAPERLGGATRSPQWPTVRAAHLKENPTCIVCGGTKKLNVHHVRPFHVHPELELQASNLVTLCTGNKTISCHVRMGHCDNFKDKWNPNIREDAALWYKRFTAKTEQEIFPDEQDTSV